MNFLNDIIAAPFICIGWIIIGAVAGALARSIMGSKNAPFFSDLILGIAGAILGGFLAGVLGIGPTASDRGLTLVLVNLIFATVGAAILIALRRVFIRG